MTKDILIVYYSHSGNTQKIAKLIQQELTATLLEIQPQTSYPTAYQTLVNQAKKEIQSNFRPVLKTTEENIESYPTIFIGTPNWWSTIAPPITTFLSEYNLSGKTVIPFCTHGGGGLARVAQDIAALCPHSTVLNSFEIYEDGSIDAQAKVSSWLCKIKEKLSGE